MKQNRRNIEKTLAEEKIFINLMKWMKSNGYRSSKHLIPANFSGFGRGMMANHNISAGDCIVSIPHSLIISTTTVFSSSLGNIILRWNKSSPPLTPMQILSLFLIYEKNKGEESGWKCYIDTLPISYTVPAYWEKSFIYTHRREHFNNQILDIKKSYSSLQTFFRFASDCNSEFNCQVTLDDFIWAWSTVQTRGVYIEKEAINGVKDNYALVPFLDLLNHSPSAKVTAGFNKKEDCYQIITHQSYAKFSQVFINYGPLDNAKLILNYGFSVLPNINSSVEIELREILECFIKLSNEINKRILEKKIEFLKKRNLLSNLSFNYGEVSCSLCICSRILVANYQEFLQCQYALGVINENNEQLSTRLLKECIDRKLKEINTIKSSFERTHNQHIAHQLCSSLIQEEVDILESCKYILLL